MESPNNLEKDQDFIRAFWNWFDSLNITEKSRFWYYQNDMAKIYFYFKHYDKIRADSLAEDGL